MSAIVSFQEELCKGCELCRAACPKGIIKMGEHLNAMGYYPAQVAQPEQCIGCAFCAMMCPDLVIKVERKEWEK